MYCTFHRIAISSLTILAVGLLVSPAKQVNAQSRFSCEQMTHPTSPNNQPEWTTVANVSRGKFPIIIWRTTKWGANFQPYERCQKVTNRFNQLNSKGELKFLYASEAKGPNGDVYPVICGSQTQAPSSNTSICPNNNILFTIEKYEKDKNYMTSQEIIDHLQDIRYGAKGPFVRGRKWIDMDDFLENAPVADPPLWGD